VVAIALLGWVLAQGRPGIVTPSAAGRTNAAPRLEADEAAAQPRSASPVIAVLPFSVVIAGDTAQFSRSAALMFAEALALRNGVQTVDANGLLGLWLAEGRRVTAPLDENARFAYGLGANQMVVGSYVESGRQFRLSANMYDTHDVSPLWRDEVTGPTDSLFQLVDRLATRAAEALCTQPEYNPGNLCFDAPARVSAPLAVAAVSPTARDQPAVGFYARVSPAGQVTDVRLKAAGADETLTSRALQALRAAGFAPARKAGRPVDAWTAVEVAVVGAAEVPAAQLAAECGDPAYGVRNPGSACFDARPVPQTSLPEIAAPADCGGTPTPATVLLRVTAQGAVDGRPTVKAPSDCAAFTAAAVAVAGAMGFAPAQKSGRPVPAWTLILVRAAPGGARGGRS
jgi:TolB-like protein